MTTNDPIGGVMRTDGGVGIFLVETIVERCVKGSLNLASTFYGLLFRATPLNEQDQKPRSVGCSCAEPVSPARDWPAAAYAVDARLQAGC